MANTRRAVFAMSAGLVLFGLNTWAGAQAVHVGPQVAYEVSADQRTVLPLEPVFLSFAVANRTADVLRNRVDPSMARATMFILRPGGQTLESDHLSSLTAGMGMVDQPMAPGAVRMAHERLMVNLDKFFPKPGTYQVRFRAIEDGSGTAFWSNVLVLQVLEPAGADRAAYDYLRQSPNPGSWFESAKKAELEDFLTYFPDSGYADVARLQLGILAHVERDYQRAAQLFTAVAGRGRSRLNDYAAEQLELTREAIRTGLR